MLTERVDIGEQLQWILLGATIIILAACSQVNNIKAKENQGLVKDKIERSLLLPNKEETAETAFVTKKVTKTVEALKALEAPLLAITSKTHSLAVKDSKVQEILKELDLELDMFQFPEISGDEWSTLGPYDISTAISDIETSFTDIAENWQGYSLAQPFECDFCISPQTPFEEIRLALEYDQIVSNVSVRYPIAEESSPTDKLKSYIVYSLVEDTYRYTAGEALDMFLQAANTCGHECADVDTQDNWEAANVLIKHSIMSPDVHDLYRKVYAAFANRTGADLRGLYQFEDFLSIWGTRDGQLLGTYIGCDTSGYAVFDPPLTDEAETIALRARNGYPTIDQALFAYNSSGYC